MPYAAKVYRRHKIIDLTTKLQRKKNGKFDFIQPLTLFFLRGKAFCYKESTLFDKHQCQVNQMKR